MKYAIVAMVCLLAGWLVHGMIVVSQGGDSTRIALDANDANSVMQFVGMTESNIDALHGRLEKLLHGQEALLASSPHIGELMDDFTSLVTKSKVQCKVVRESARAILRGDESEAAQTSLAQEVAMLIVYSAQGEELEQSLLRMLEAELDRLQGKLSEKRRADARATLAHVDECQQKLEAGMKNIAEAVDSARAASAKYPRLAQAAAEYDLTCIVLKQRCEATRLVAQLILDGDTSDEAANELEAQHKGLSAMLQRLVDVSRTLLNEMENANSKGR
jgi:hypothetical protein